MKESRRKYMAELIAQRRRMTMQELCDYFQVSMNTIRTDVAHLVSTGAVAKVYGGVQVADQKQVPLFTSRTLLHTDNKQRIAVCAEQLIQDKDIIYIDAGTTTMHLIDCLDQRKHVTIVTANLSVIHKAYEHENVELIVLPGTVNRRTNSISGISTLEFLNRYQFNKAFMAASGISEDGRLNTSTYIEYEIKRTALKQSRQAYLLADSAKFGTMGLMAYGTLDDMTAVITDPDCPDFAKKFCSERNIPILWA